MPSRHEVIWTPRASEELIQVLAYLDRQSITGGNRFRVEFESTLDRLCELPKLGAVYLRRTDVEIREVFVRPYRVFYHIIDEQSEIEVLRIQHSKRKNPRFTRRRRPS